MTSEYVSIAAMMAFCTDVPCIVTGKEHMTMVRDHAIGYSLSEMPHQELISDVLYGTTL